MGLNSGSRDLQPRVTNIKGTNLKSLIKARGMSKMLGRHSSTYISMNCSEPETLNV